MINNPFYLNIKVKPNSSKSKLIKLKNQYYQALIKSPAKNNLANQELINLLSRHFNSPKYNIIIIKGHRSNTKLLKIN